jgi:DNA repair exonuclease SbcCD nuclease subunit
MKIALITDTHFGARNDNLSFNEYFYKFWEEVFFPYIEKEGIDTVIHLGDVMDRRKFVSYKIAQDFRTRFIQRFVDKGVTLHMMVGNHDTFYKNTNDVNSLAELVEGRYPNMFVYPEATTVEFDGTPICFLPWICPDNYGHTMEHIKETKAQVAMGHLEINGFEMHAGHFAEGGYDKQFLNKFDTVFSGHFHKKSDDGQVYYLGNTYQMTWSDNGCPKGFHVFDTSTRELERIINPYTIFEKV